MTRIRVPEKEGEPRVVTIIPRPPVPFRAPKEPERKPIREPVPVPVRRVKVPAGPGDTHLEKVGFSISEIPYACPECSREMVMEDGELYCPVHGSLLVKGVR